MNVSNPYQDSEGYPYKFDFTRLGLRVPAIVVSPWLAKGVDSTIYEHSSVPATLKHIFNLSSDYLTSRDKEAHHFFKENELLDTMRTDCPETLPNPPTKGWNLNLTMK